MDGATKTSKFFAKIAGKKIVHKSAEATGDLVGNKIADKITSMGEPRSKKEKDETKKWKKHKKFIFLQKRESK